LAADSGLRSVYRFPAMVDLMGRFCPAMNQHKPENWDTGFPLQQTRDALAPRSCSNRAKFFRDFALNGGL
jgi:hypothetical protein